jgi:nitric-oxide synthase, brain
MCIKLGWRTKRTEWDVLPLVLSANGHDPDYFEYPAELILEVPLTHPSFKWFGEFNLRWYALPAVSGMMFDCGGIQFTGTAFSGWYMSTEIGCRNLCDTNRRNILEVCALHSSIIIVCTNRWFRNDLYKCSAHQLETIVFLPLP